MPAPLISIGQLIDRSWDYFHERFPALMQISVWVIISTLISTIVAFLVPTVEKVNAGTGWSGLEIFGGILKIGNGLIIGPVLALWVFIALVLYTNSLLARRRKTVKDILTQAWHVFVPVLVVSVLIILILLAGIIIGLGPATIFILLASWTGSRILLGIAYLLFVIGTVVAFVLNIRWSVQLVLAPIITISDGTKGVAALKKSRELVKGRFWAVLIRLVIPKLLVLAIGLVALYILTVIIGSTIYFLPETILSQTWLLILLTQVIPILVAVITVITQPFMIIADVLLYDSLRTRRS